MLLTKTIKVIFWGDGGVGKTSIIKRFLYNVFEEGSVKSTYGLEVYTKMLSIGGRKIYIAFWDFGGQPQFRSVVRVLARGIDIFVFVFDLSDPDALTKERVQPLFSAIGAALQDSKIPKILVGSKTDLPRAIFDDNILDFMMSYNFDDYFEVSAKNGENIQALFDRIFQFITEITLHDKSIKSSDKKYNFNKVML